jgi:hypothetical protein
MGEGSHTFIYRRSEGVNKCWRVFEEGSHTFLARMAVLDKCRKYIVFERKDIKCSRESQIIGVAEFASPGFGAAEAMSNCPIDCRHQHCPTYA